MCGSPVSRSCRAAVRRDLPMPGSPEMSTICPSRSLARSQRRSNSSISASRPTKGVTGADQIADHDKASGDADPAGQSAGAALQPADALDERQPGPPGVVLMRLRIAEIDQNAVAHVFGDVTLEPADDLRDGGVIGAQQLAHILRVEAGGERRRPR